MAKKRAYENGDSVSLARLRVDIKTVAIIVSTVVTVMGSYFALASKANALNDRLGDQAKQIEKLQATVDMQQRAIIELSVAARLHVEENGR